MARVTSVASIATDADVLGLAACDRRPYRRTYALPVTHFSRRRAAGRQRTRLAVPRHAQDISQSNLSAADSSRLTSRRSAPRWTRHTKQLPRKGAPAAALGNEQLHDRFKKVAFPTQLDGGAG
jgi:hypothetical protein